MSNTRTAPLHLWRIAEAFLHTLYNVFGAPEDVARQHTFTREPHQLLLKWIRAGEALIRRLLLIEAASYPKPNTRPLLHIKRPRKRRVMGFDHDKPEEWRVSFRCFAVSCPRQRSRTRPVRTNPYGLPSFHSAWPLAERYEALIRVFNDPAPYARRLAAKLHATSHRARELIAYPEGAPDLIGRVAFAETDAPALEAAKRIEPG